MANPKRQQGRQLVVKLLRRSNRMYQPAPQGTSRLRIFHRKKVGKRDARYLIKCGCCEQELEIYYGDGTLEINGVMGSLEDWRQILLPLLGVRPSRRVRGAKGRPEFIAT